MTTTGLGHSSSVPEELVIAAYRRETQVPLCPLTAGANTRQSSVALRPEEWVGRMDVESKIQGKIIKI